MPHHTAGVLAALDGSRGGRPHHVWATMPAEVAAVFRPRASDTARYMLREIRLHVPEYETLADQSFIQTLARGVDAAVAQFINRIEQRDLTSTRQLAQRFRRVGRREFTDGRSLDSLLAAYRIGGQVAWRRAAESCCRAGVSTRTLCLVAEAIFAFVDEISTLSIEGFTTAQTRSVGVIERRRRQLLELLLAEQRVGQHHVTELAAAAGWSLPDRVAVVALSRPSDYLDDPFPDFGPEVLADLESGSPCLVTADPRRHLRDLRTDLPGWKAAVGPMVPIEDARTSLQLACRGLAAIQQGILPDKMVTNCTEHLATLWLLSDRVTMHALADRALAPLADLTAKQQARLADTLLAWLETRGGAAPDVAARLGVHPQTVRYRLRNLEKLFGARLDDPDARFDMELALRALRLSDYRRPKASPRPHPGT